MGGPPILARLKKEATALTNSDIKDVGAIDIDETCRNIIGFIKGPKNSPFENGFFKLAIHIPNQYPFVPPQIRFLTKVWHPNISSATGAICLDILKDEWTPAFTLKSTLLAIEALLTAAEPTDPQDAVVAHQYQLHYDEYVATAKLWTEKYAKVEIETEGEQSIRELVQMGFSKTAVHNALNANHWNKEKALNELLK